MKFGKRIISLVLALVMMFSLVVSASAADTRTPITAYLDYNITIQYNGKAQALSDANGNQVYPVSYNGTTMYRFALSDIC